MKVVVETKERVLDGASWEKSPFKTSSCAEEEQLLTNSFHRKQSETHRESTKESASSETKSCQPHRHARVLLRLLCCRRRRLRLRCCVDMTIAPFKLPRFLIMLFSLLLLLLLLLMDRRPVQALLHSHHYGPSPLSKWQEKVFRQRMSVCYQDIDIGLWGEACKASAIDKENCAMKCLSSACYESIYGADPLEEGELDVRRGREFRFCVRKAERAEKDGLHVSR